MSHRDRVRTAFAKELTHSHKKIKWQPLNAFCHMTLKTCLTSSLGRDAVPLESVILLCVVMFFFWILNEPTGLKIGLHKVVRCFSPALLLEETHSSLLCFSVLFIQWLFPPSTSQVTPMCPWQRASCPLKKSRWKWLVSSACERSWCAGSPSCASCELQTHQCLCLCNTIDYPEGWTCSWMHDELGGSSSTLADYSYRLACGMTRCIYLLYLNPHCLYHKSSALCVLAFLCCLTIWYW